MNNPKHTPGPHLVIWFNIQKGFGEYASKQGPVFFTAYDCVGTGTPRPGQHVKVRRTVRAAGGAK